MSLLETLSIRLRHCRLLNHYCPNLMHFHLGCRHAIQGHCLQKEGKASNCRCWMKWLNKVCHSGVDRPWYLGWVVVQVGLWGDSSLIKWAWILGGFRFKLRIATPTTKCCSVCSTTEICNSGVFKFLIQQYQAAVIQIQAPICNPDRAEWCLYSLYKQIL